MFLTSFTVQRRTMFGPYRTPADPPPVEQQPHLDDEIVLAWALTAVGGLRVAVAIATRERWGGEATLAAGMALCGIRMLLHRRRAARGGRVAAALRSR